MLYVPLFLLKETFEELANQQASRVMSLLSDAVLADVGHESEVGSLGFASVALTFVFFHRSLEVVGGLHVLGKTFKQGLLLVLFDYWLVWLLSLLVAWVG